MRALRLLSAAALLAAAVRPGLAQTPIPTTTTIATPTMTVPNLTVASLKDTIIISAFSINNGATSVGSEPLTMTHRLIGYLPPAGYRVSRYPDFRDATWQQYPSSGVITVAHLAPSSTTPCPGGGLPITAYFQVRGLVLIAGGEGGGRFVLSQVVSDDICWFVG